MLDDRAALCLLWLPLPRELSCTSLNRLCVPCALAPVRFLPAHFCSRAGATSPAAAAAVDQRQRLAAQPAAHCLHHDSGLLDTYHAVTAFCFVLLLLRSALRSPCL